MTFSSIAGRRMMHCASRARALSAVAAHECGVGARKRVTLPIAAAGGPSVEAPRRAFPSASGRRAFSSATATADLADPARGLEGEGREFYEAAKAFADTEWAPHASEWDEKKIFPEDALRKAAAMGFASMWVSAESGGLGLGRSASLPALEALASSCPSTAAYVSIHGMAAKMIDQYGTAEAKAKYVPGLVSMDLFASYCLTEPGAGSDAASLSTKAVLAPGGKEYVLDGQKAFISGGGRSDVYVVMARTGGLGAGGISAFVVEKGTPGLSFGANERKMGWNSQPTAQVFFEGVRVPVANRLGAEGGGFKMAMQALDGGRLSIASCSLGAASAAFAKAREHVQVRKQFGGPLSNQQAVAFMIADMAMDLVVSRSAVRDAARALDASEPTARAHCALAKAVATEKCLKVCDTALQALGGYGYLKDYSVERYLRDARVHTILEGTSQVMRVILARSLLTGA